MATAAKRAVKSVEKAGDSVTDALLDQMATMVANGYMQKMQAPES